MFSIHHNHVSGFCCQAASATSHLVEHALAMTCVRQDPVPCDQQPNGLESMAHLWDITPIPMRLRSVSDTCAILLGNRSTTFQESDSLYMKNNNNKKKRKKKKKKKKKRKQSIKQRETNE